MKTSVTRLQLVVVTVITLILLAAGIGVAATYGDFSMRSVSSLERAKQLDPR